jgi:hypothetical protein
MGDALLKVFRDAALIDFAAIRGAEILPSQ